MRHTVRKSIVAATLLTALGVSAQAQTFVPGYLKFESWIQSQVEGNPPELGGANLDDATVLPAIPGFGAPTETLYMSAFNTRTVYPDDSHNNYLARITGVLVVPETADYHFFLRSDDDSRFYINLTGETPPDVTTGLAVPIIREELDCCDGWIAPGEDTDGDGFGDSPSTDAEATTVTPIRLTAGTRYGITAILKEGGGGDWMEVDVRKVGDTRANAPLPGSFLGTTVPALAITTQPQATVTATENVPVTLSVSPGRGGYPGLTFQWRVNGAPIDGATNDTYTLTPTLADDNKQYSVVLSSPVNAQSVTSGNSVLDVSNDTTAPTIGFASAFHGRDGVQVAFSEPMSPTGLTSASSYSISGGVTVNSVEQVSPSSVFLRTSALTAGTSYTVTATGLRDQASGAGNALTANTATFTPVAPPAGTQLNMANYQRWGANEGVSSLDTLEEAIQLGTPPEVDSLVSLFEAPVNAANNYAARVRGYFIPPVSGEYVFFGASDDPGRFFLSTDSDPANKKLIALEPSWNGSRVWLGTANRNPETPENRSDTFVDTEWPSGGNNIALVAGQAYYVELRFSEGGGGDNGAMTFKIEGEADPASGTAPRIAGTNVVWYADVSAVAPVFSKTPVGTNYNKGATITLEADAFGAQPITWQWFRNKRPIEGATQKTYTIQNADHRHLGDYSVEATNPVGVNDTKRQDNSARLIMNGAKFLIEAEDFNYGGGQHVPISDQMPYRGNAYAGLQPTLDVDFFHDGDNSGGAAFAYNRHAPADEGVIEIKGPADPADYNRGSWTVTNNYALGWTTLTEWQNYTRVFPQGRYVIYGGHAHDGLAEDEVNMILSRVANPTTPDGSAVGVEGGGQGLTKIGQFLSPGTGAWSSNDIIPLTDDTGNLVEVDLNGQTTLRLTFNAQDGDADFFLFYCLTCPDEPIGGPVASITRSGNSITISSDSGGTVEASPTLVPANWTALGAAPQTVNADGTMRYFRLRR